MVLVTKSEVIEMEELVTKTPGYVRRTRNPAMGRPAIGTTRKVSLTLSDETWSYVDREVARGRSRSEVLRELIEGGNRNV